MKTFLPLLALFLFCSCAGLDPKADPIVVRAEQAQTITESTFNLITDIDQADRGFWRTNAPAFHNFVETLRVKVPVAGLPPIISYSTNEARVVSTSMVARLTLPKYVAVQWELDRAKLSYKAVKSAASSNALNAALVSINALSQQASGWLTIITNR